MIVERGKKYRVVHDNGGFFMDGEIVVALDGGYGNDMIFFAKEDKYQPGKSARKYKWEEFGCLYIREIEEAESEE